jgi:hypothetical protein
MRQRSLRPQHLNTAAVSSGVMLRNRLGDASSAELKLGFLAGGDMIFLIQTVYNAE